MSTHQQATSAPPARRGCLRYDGDMASDRLGSQSQTHLHTKDMVVDKRGEREQVARGGASKRHRPEETDGPSPKRQRTHPVDDVLSVPSWFGELVGRPVRFEHGGVLPGKEVGEDVLPVPSWFEERVGRPRRFVRCGVSPGFRTVAEWSRHYGIKPGLQD